ncbi:hypothetical protein FQR65_LT07121 [Abscondita terminalis]|nr:hypothetical protein FQR65_LT07121 [Abscondita terminalis]
MKDHSSPDISKMLKIIITLYFVTITHCQNEDQGAQSKIRGVFNSYKNECIEKSKVEPGLVDQLLADVHSPKSEELKCYIECTLSKSNLVDKDLKLNSDELKKIVPDESTSIANELTEDCEKVGSGSNCSKAYEILKCLLTELQTKFGVSV